MKTLHDGANPVPRETCFLLRDADKQENKEAEKHMGIDALILPMINRPQIQGGLQGTEGPLHFQKLLVPQGDVLRG